MRNRYGKARVVAIAVLSMICASGVATATAQTAADPPTSPRVVPPVAVLASGLQDPREISLHRGHLIVTEAGAGKVTSISLRNPQNVRTLVSGLGEQVSSGAVKRGKRLFITTAEAGGPPGRLSPDSPTYPASSVLVAKRNRRTQLMQVNRFADLLAFELANNPDGQTQFDDSHNPLDALSNPFYILRMRGWWGRGPRLLVADGGANDVLKVGRRGKVSTFFVPPTVNTGACAGRPNNDAQTTGCDAVPTGIAYGPGNRLYVSALTGEAPGEGRVYVLNADTGKLKWTVSGFTTPTGVAVAPNGAIYVSEVMEGMPQGPPAPGFDPATVGRIVRVAPNGQRTYAQVAMPTGLLWHRGSLYSTTWSVGSFMGMANSGQVVRVAGSAFMP